MTLSTAFENARVVDGTGAPWFRGAIGVQNGQIDRVVREPSISDSADERVDLDGQVLCPGFIDTHSHSDLRLFDEPVLAPKTRQGITTEILGQDGFSMAPMYRDGGAKAWEDHLSGLDGRASREWTWGSVTDYFDAIDETGVGPNVAMLVGHGTVRYNVMGMDDRLPDESELEAMAALVTEALEAGAVGFSTGLIYTPQVHSNTEEVRTLASRLEPYGRPFVAHIRNETDDIWGALDEFIDIGDSENVPLHLSHFKLALAPQHGKAGRAISLIEAARERGVDFTADQYPYTAGSTMLGVVLPSWVRADGTDKAVEHLSDPDSRAAIRKELEDRSNPWENTVVTSVATDENAHLEGLNIEEVAAERGEDPVTAVLNLLREERLEVSKITHMLSEADVREILQYERAIVATDGLLGGKPHPRTYGTYPRVLGHYVRDENLLALEAAVRMMTSLPARAMGLQTKGIVRPGMDADLVVFDPQTVGTDATFQNPRRHPSGMPHVVVDGEFVVRDGDRTGATPGRVHRK